MSDLDAYKPLAEEEYLPVARRILEDDDPNLPPVAERIATMLFHSAQTKYSNQWNYQARLRAESEAAGLRGPAEQAVLAWHDYRKRTPMDKALHELGDALGEDVGLAFLARLAEAEASVEQLRAALEPFAKLSEEFLKYYEGDDELAPFGMNNVRISVGDLRRAAEVLEEK